MFWGGEAAVSVCGGVSGIQVKTPALSLQRTEGQGRGTRLSKDRSQRQNQRQSQKSRTGVSNPHELSCCGTAGEDARRTAAGTAALHYFFGRGSGGGRAAPPA